MSTYTETIELEDKVTPAAERARTSLENIGAGLASANKDLAGKGLEGAGMATQSLGEKTFNAANAIEVGKNTIHAAIGAIGNAFKSLAAGDVQGAVAGVTEAVAGLAGLLDLVVPGLGQAVAAVVKIAGGLVGITAGLIQSGMAFAIESANGKKQMLAMFAAMAGGQKEAEELDEMLSALADTTGITKDDLAPLTAEFLKMGVTGTEALEKLTLAAISAKSIGDDAGAAFMALSKKVAIAGEQGEKFKLDTKAMKSLMAMGVSADDLAKRLGVTKEALMSTGVDAAKFGDALADAVTEKGAGSLKLMGSTIDNIKKKFMQDLGDMFEDIDVAPFLAALKDLFGIFAASTDSGAAMKSGIAGAFQYMFDVVTPLVPLVKHFLLDLVIWALQAYIAAKPLIAKLRELWDSAKESGALEVAFQVIVGAAIAVGVAVAAVVVVFGAMWALMVGIGLAIWAVIGGLVALGAAIVGAVSSSMTMLLETLSSLWTSINEILGGFPQMAVDAALGFITGLVNGITSGAGMVWDAVKNLGSGLIDTFKGVLGIASPSSVMQDLGEGGIGAGLVGGIGDAANDVHGAASSLATAAVGGAEAGAAAPAAPAAAGASVVVYITVEGAGKSAQEITDEMAASAFERAALAMGA